MFKDLLAWAKRDNRKPLILRGARQVGKSTSVKLLAEALNLKLVTLDFERFPALANLFTSNDPYAITQLISLQTNQSIKAGEALLFLDEIQAAPKILATLRYFYEEMPELHIVCAGSLLEFALEEMQFSMPVGRIEYMYLGPMSFEEFLVAINEKRLCDFLNKYSLGDPYPTSIHEKLLQLLKIYMIVGGMPEALAYFVEHHDYLRAQALQSALRENYRQDFGKYAAKGVKIQNLIKIYDSIPSLIGKHFKFTAIDPDTQARELKPSLKALEDAGLIHIIYHTAASGLPFNTTINENRKKILFIDVGLLNNASSLSAKEMLNDNLILLSKGALAEQFVGQEFCAYDKNYTKSQLFYWEREKPSIAEVDYVIHYESNILAVEVKSGKTGRLKSLQQFITEKSSKIGIRISEKPLAFENNILSIPMYMIFELDRLLENIL